MASVKKTWAIVCNTIIVVLGLGIISMPAFADDDYRPYIGAGAQLLRLEVPKEYGQLLFQRTIPGANVFAGVRFGQFGVELGSNYFSKKRNARLNAGDIFPGSGLTLFQWGGFAWADYKTEMKIKDINLSATGYLPLDMLSCALDKTELFATVGLSRTSVKARLEVVAASGVAVDPGTEIRNFKQNKTIPFVRLGLQQNLTDNVNVSLFTEWKRLGSFKMISKENNVMQLRLKNSMSYGLRVGYMF